LKDLNIPPGETIDSITINKLAAGPSRQVTSWNAYEINGCTYYTYTNDSKFVNQNSGVRVVAIDKDGQKADYFGIIEEIWELDYGSEELNVALFRCRWIKQYEFNDIGLRVVDLQNIGYHDDPWVLASRVTQVFYMTDPLSIIPPQRRNLSMWLSLGNNTLSELMVSTMLKPTISAIRCRYSQTLLRRLVSWKKPTQRHIAMGTKRCEVENCYGGGGD
jgi:hypothetical protein